MLPCYKAFHVPYCFIFSKKTQSKITFQERFQPQPPLHTPLELAFLQEIRRNEAWYSYVHMKY